jgi:hypothetical protein
VAKELTSTIEEGEGEVEVEGEEFDCKNNAGAFSDRIIFSICMVCLKFFRAYLTVLEVNFLSSDCLLTSKPNFSRLSNNELPKCSLNSKISAYESSIGGV